MITRTTFSKLACMGLMLPLACFAQTSSLDHAVSRAGAVQDKTQQQREQAQARERDEVSALVRRADAWSTADEHGKAGDAYLEAARKISTNPILYNLAGISYTLAGKNEQAILAFSRSIYLAPQRADIYRMRGIAYRHEGNIGKALVDFATAVQLAPERLDARWSLALVLENAGQPQASLDEYGEILRIAPNSVEAHIFRADVLTKVGRDGDALSEYEAASRIEPDDPGLLHLRMQFWFYQGKFEAVISDADRWLSLKRSTSDGPYIAYVLLWRHMAAKRLNVDDRDALESAKDKLGRNEWPYPLIQFALGEINETQLRAATASGDPAKLKDRQCEALTSIGESYVARHSEKIAERLFSSALEVCPTTSIEHLLVTRELEQIDMRRTAKDL